MRHRKSTRQGRYRKYSSGGALAGKNSLTASFEISFCQSKHAHTCKKECRHCRRRPWLARAACANPGDRAGHQMPWRIRFRRNRPAANLGKKAGRGADGYQTAGLTLMEQMGMATKTQRFQ